MSRFGGGKYGGIEPSRTTPNVFIYSDPSKAVRYGYNFDGWNDDRTIFFYTGEGRRGPQTMTAGNLALFAHLNDGRALRLFVADGVVEGTSEKQHRYLGRFELDRDDPYSEQDSVDEDGTPRTVIVFRLCPLGETLTREEDASAAGGPSTQTRAEIVEREKAGKANFTKNATTAGVGQRREAQLVERYAAYLRRDLKRWKITPCGSMTTLYSDHYDPETHELYEAKGNATRDNIRQAIGQLLDYRHHIQRENHENRDLKITVLLPGRPNDDIADLLKALGIGCVYELPTGGFKRELG